MDKVKHFLELARKHHFWILCGVSAVVGLIVWYMSTSQLDTEFKAEQNKTIDTNVLILSVALTAGFSVVIGSFASDIQEAERRTFHLVTSFMVRRMALAQCCTGRVADRSHAGC